MSSDVLAKIKAILKEDDSMTKSSIETNKKSGDNLYFLDYNLMSASQGEYTEISKYFNEFCTSYPTKLDSTLLLSTDMPLDDFYEKVCEKEIDIFIIIDIKHRKIRYKGISDSKTTALLKLYH